MALNQIGIVGQEYIIRYSLVVDCLAYIHEECLVEQYQLIKAQSKDIYSDKSIW